MKRGIGCGVPLLLRMRWTIFILALAAFVGGWLYPPVFLAALALTLP